MSAIRRVDCICIRVKDTRWFQPYPYPEFCLPEYIDVCNHRDNVCLIYKVLIYKIVYILVLTDTCIPPIYALQRDQTTCLCAYAQSTLPECIHTCMHVYTHTDACTPPPPPPPPTHTHKQMKNVSAEGKSTVLTENHLFVCLCFVVDCEHSPSHGLYNLNDCMA